jgi:hypothetical protein
LSANEFDDVIIGRDELEADLGVDRCTQVIPERALLARATLLEEEHDLGAAVLLST